MSIFSRMDKFLLGFIILTVISLTLPTGIMLDSHIYWVSILPAFACIAVSVAIAIGQLLLKKNSLFAASVVTFGV